jgi:hypothetical protein
MYVYLRKWNYLAQMGLKLCRLPIEKYLGVREGGTEENSGPLYREGNKRMVKFMQ